MQHTLKFNTKPQVHASMVDFGTLGGEEEEERCDIPPTN
jgi:hypothetical protein